MGSSWQTWQRGLVLTLYAVIAGLLALASAAILLAVVGFVLDLLHWQEPGDAWLWIVAAQFVPFFLGWLAHYYELQRKRLK